MSRLNRNPSLKFASSSTSKIFKCTHQANNISKKLQTFYKEKEFFDIVLVTETDGCQVHAHRIVLSAASDYFLAMFRSNLKKSRADEIELGEIDGATLISIVDFMYSASIELDNESVESILKAADFFQMRTLVAACCDFMGEQLDASNCVGIALLAEHHNCTKLCERSSTFASKHFEAVCREQEFFQLNADQLSKFIFSDHCAPSEEQIFLSLAAWVEYDSAKREAETFNLLSRVRFMLLKPKFIIENRHSVCKTVECYELICSWLQWHLSPSSRLEIPPESTGRRKAGELLAFTSGCSTDDLKVQTFNPELNTWSFEEFPRSPKKRADYRLTGINKKLIIAGGQIDGHTTDSVECLDLQTKKWTELPPMRRARCLPGMAELNGDLYVIGGCDSNLTNWSCSVEKYDFSTREWQDVAPLPSPFQHLQVAVLGGFLYVVGNGYSVMECYDPFTNEWSQKSFKNEECDQFGFAGVGEYLYAVGGRFNGRESKTVERYNPATDTWTVISSLGSKQRHMICAGVNNRLVACRGHDGKRFVNFVEEYNPETNKWTNLNGLVPHQLCFYSASLFTI